MKKTSATMDSQPFGQSDDIFSSSSGSSKQSFYTQPPESPIFVTYSTFLNNERHNNYPSPETEGLENETGAYTPSQRLSSSPSPSSHKWHPTTNPSFSNNRNYQTATPQQGGSENNFFPYPHANNDEASCLCLPSFLVRAVLNLAAGIEAIACRVIETLRTGAAWVPPVPPESESDSEFEFERGLERRLGRRGRRWRRGVRKWKGRPPPIFVPRVLPLLRNRPIQEDEVSTWELERGREGEVPLRRLGEGISSIGERVAGRYREVEDEGSNDGDALDGNERKKKWKGKEKAVDVARSSRELLGSGPRDIGKLQRGTYVPVQPDRRGTRWEPRGGHEYLGEEEEGY